MTTKTLAERMKGRPAPSPEAFAKAFGGTRSAAPESGRGPASFTLLLCVVVAETRDAIGIEHTMDLRLKPLLWLPRSQVLHDVPKGYRGPITVTAWLARKEGWIE